MLDTVKIVKLTTETHTREYKRREYASDKWEQSTDWRLVTKENITPIHTI